MRRRGHFDEVGAKTDPADADFEKKYMLPTDDYFGATSPDQVTVRPTSLSSEATPSAPQSYGANNQGLGSAQNYNGNNQSYGAPQSYNANGQSYGAPQSYNANGQGYGTAQGLGAEKPVTERPMVFALRSDSSLYVYEFSDRLEFYRNTDGGMLLCNVEYKRR